MPRLGSLGCHTGPSEPRVDEQRTATRTKSLLSLGQTKCHGVEFVLGTHLEMETVGAEADHGYSCVPTAL